MVKWKIKKSKTALLVVDVTNNFIQEGMPQQVPPGREIIPKLKNMIIFCRKSKIPIIYFTHCYRRDGSNVGLAPKVFNLDYPPKGKVACENTKGVEVYEEVKPAENDIVIEKTRYGSFYTTDLELVLRGLGVDTLLITGVQTDCCVNATAVGAYERDFKVIVLSDCTATYDEETQRVALNTLSRVVGEVASSSDVIKRLQKS